MHRIASIDFFRGFLLLFIVFYHYIFDLYYFFGFDINPLVFPYSLIPPISSAGFLIVSGISTHLSRNSFKRGVFVLFFAMIITLISYFVAPDEPITFGILHCIGSLMIFGFYMKKIPSQALGISAVLFYALGSYWDGMYTGYGFLFPLGLTTASYRALDFYPLFPNGAFFIVGIMIGRKIDLKKHDFDHENIFFKVMRFGGKNSLWVYLLHQPIFIIILWMNEILFK